MLINPFFGEETAQAWLLLFTTVTRATTFGLMRKKSRPETERQFCAS